MTGVYTVSQINSYIKNMFVRDFALSNICIAGEISNCKYHTAGHIYFTLKDESASIACVMFASRREGLDFRLSDGQQVEARGQVSVYEKGGSYQLYVKSIRLSGQGELYERYLRLKQELEDMGMFDEMYKKKIPSYAMSIGIVTSPTGAVIRDICNVAHRRNPYTKLVLYPALVQGEGAADSLIRGIRKLDSMGLDVLIIGRGGGSIEDLWAFNEEKLARAIFEAETPIVSAVGHETDFTIADFVADMRASTPSAAAELCTFEYELFERELSQRRDGLCSAFIHRLEYAKRLLENKRLRLLRHDPAMVLSERKRRLSDMLKAAQRAVSDKLRNRSLELEGYGFDMYTALKASITDRKHGLELRAGRLDMGSPLKRISGGYGYISDERGQAVSSVSGISQGMELRLRLRDGLIYSEVERVEKKELETDGSA